MADELIKPTPAASRSALEAGAVDARLCGARQRSKRGRLAAALAMIAGFVDAYGMITYGVYVSFMSGNTTQTGYQTAEGAFGPASLSALAILFFVVGSFAGTLLVQFTGRRARRAVFGVVAAALAAVIGFTQLGFLSAGVRIASVSFAMGMMNSALSRVGAQVGEPHFRDRNAEPRRVEPRARAEARAPSGRAGAVGHPSAPGHAFGSPLGRVPGRRVVVGRSHAAVRRVGSIGAGADPCGAGGVRSS